MYPSDSFVRLSGAVRNACSLPSVVSLIITEVIMEATVTPFTQRIPPTVHMITRSYALNSI